jgi:hypothetical protein
MPLKVSDGIGSWIKDFQKSDAPQFKGKSDKDRRDQAIAAYLSAKRGKKEDVDEVNELDTSTLVSYRKKANKQRYSNNISKRIQRTAGVDRADKKLRKRNIDKFGNHSPKGVDKMGNPKEDSSDAVKAFLAKGGKIKKLPPAKAQGYHGKDDPGKGMHGMLDKPDTKKIGTRKKAKSMEATQVDEISKDTKKSYIKKAADDMSKQADRMARAQRGDGKMDKAANKFVNRRKGIARAVENYQVQKYTDGKKDGPAKSFGGDLKKATAHASKMGGDHRVHKEAKDKPPFDNPKPIQKDTKDRYGNPIKNRAKHLARKAARDLVNKQKNESSYDKLNKYNKDAQASKDKATNSAVATILRKGDHSKDLNTMRKRERGLKMVRSRVTDKIRKGHKADEGYVSHAQRKAVWASRADAKKGK